MRDMLSDLKIATSEILMIKVDVKKKNKKTETFSE